MGATAEDKGATEEAASAGPLVEIQGLSHFFGKGALRKQILYDISEAVWPGEIVILTGPSGSGKTTLLTLIGALRAAQEGSLNVLGRELLSATEATLTEVRQGIGYIFQAHNLLDALTATQNVQMALLDTSVPPEQAKQRSRDMLDAVGLGDRLDHYPGQLSGGQKQRVAIARALGAAPRLILADEPTASLDKKSGRDVVEIMQSLTKQEGCAVVLVTHDNRILDIADRIVHLEDGHLASYAEAVADTTQQLLSSFSRTTTNQHVIDKIESSDASAFAGALETMTRESTELLRLLELAGDETFRSLLSRVLRSVTSRIGEMLEAQRATLYLVDREAGEIWSEVATDDAGQPVEIHMRLGEGIAGHVGETGEAVNIPDAYSDDRFNPEVDVRTGFTTRSILCLPLRGQDGEVFAVTQLLNKHGGKAFDAADQERFAELTPSLAVILESWWKMTRARGHTVGRRAKKS